MARQSMSSPSILRFSGQVFEIGGDEGPLTSDPSSPTSAPEHPASVDQIVAIGRVLVKRIKEEPVFARDRAKQLVQREIVDDRATNP